jgi:hypothetical protein
VRHPLTRALAGVGLQAEDVAARLAVDPKTVQRWLTGRTPFPRHRRALADLTGWDVHDLWPQAGEPVSSPGTDEVRVVYTNRAAVPTDAWHALFAHAEREIGILTYAGLFLAEDATVQRTLRQKAGDGVRVRIALGDPDGAQVGHRGADEGIGDVMSGKIRNALVLYEALADVAGVEIRLHDTVLYSSIYRADDEVIVNPHVYAAPAAHAPTMHLRRGSEDGMVATYLDSFEHVWRNARPVTGTAPASGT